MHKQLLLILSKIFFVTLLFSFPLRVFSQEIPVTLKIQNQKREPLAFASVTVINRLDSNQILKKVADSSGIAKFDFVLS